MTGDLERLANGVLWPGFLGTEAPQWLLSELQGGLAGAVYFGQNVGDGLSDLSASILAANPDALIGIDEEGGSVTRLESATGSTLPGAAQLGVLDDLGATEATGIELARRVRAIGGNVILGPVADVNTDPRNPVIGVRSFGSDEQLVSRHVVAEVDGIQAGAVAACVKHFPGHGDTHLDSHHALPEIALGIEEFERVHLAPFRAAVDAGVDAVMTAHIVVPARGEAPATLNPRVLGMLREWGFEGVIITDALDMAAIREAVGIGGGAAQALAAGADLLCIGNPTNPGDAALPDQDRRDFLAARDGIIQALRDGSLSRERVEDAAARVAALAARLRAAASATPTERAEPTAPTERAEPTAPTERAEPTAPTAPTAPAEPAEFDAAAVVRRAIAAAGGAPSSAGAPAAASALAVVDARQRSSLAVDSAAGYVSGALAAGDHLVRLDVAGSSAEEQDRALGGAVAAGGTTVVLVDRPDADAGQRALIDRVALRDPAAVVVNVGLAARHPLPLPTIEIGAASRVGAEIARELLLEGVSPTDDRGGAG